MQEANGESSKTAQSPFANVRLSVDAYTLDSASGKRRLRAIEHDGSLTFDEPKAPRTKRTEHLERIWNEYPDGLLDLTEDVLQAAEPSTVFGDEDNHEKTKENQSKGFTFESGKLMTSDEMEALRSEVYGQLNDARNELWFILELAKTLSASSSFTSDPPPQSIPSAIALGKKAKAKHTLAATATATGTATPSADPTTDEPPILPAGTYSTTPSSAPLRPAYLKAYDLELAIAAKERAIDDCAALIDSAVDELRLMADAGNRFWADVSVLRDGQDGRGQWAVVPKPDFGRTSAPGETAKDIVLPYALDEAPPAIRSRSLAAFDLDPRKRDSLTFGARSYLRLRVLLSSGTSLWTSTLYDARTENAEDVRTLIEAAQVETVDEDLFNELRAEAVRMDGSVVEGRNIVIRIGKEELTLQMYDTRETFAPLTHSPSCDFLLSAARLGLLHFHQRRKQRLIDPVNTSALATLQIQAATQHTILQPLIHIVQFYNVCNAILPTLKTFCDTLQGAGMSATILQRYSISDDDGEEAVYNLLAGRAKIDMLGSVFTLEVVGCHGITVNVSAPSNVSVNTSRATSSLRDLDQLAQLIADDLETQLGPLTFSTLHDAIEDEHLRQSVFFDELEGNVIAADLGILSVTIPAPFHAVFASPEILPSESDMASYDSRISAQSLVEWLHDLTRWMLSSELDGL